MDYSILEELNLTKNEVAIYTTLIKECPTTTGPLIKITGITSSRVYASLTSLIRKGLVSTFKKNKKTFFTAENPDLLLEKLNDTKEKIEPIIEQLKRHKKEPKKPFESRVFEGYAGFKTAFKLIIEMCTSKDEILTLGFSTPLHSIENLRIFLKNIDRKRIEKRIPMKIIFEDKIKTTIGSDREKEPFTKVRYMPEGYFSPSAINIFKDYVLIELWEEQPAIFMIKNTKIAQSFKNYFEFLWRLGKPK